MSEAQTLCRLCPAFDPHLWTATDILNPAIAIIDRGGCLGVLLARNMSTEQDGTLLRGVQWIRLPLGLRRNVHRLLSRFIPIRLPEEWRFNEVLLTLAPNGMFVARIGQEPRHPLVLPSPSQFPYPTQPLTPRRYELLARSRGRFFEAQVYALFSRHLGLDGQRAAAAPAPGYPVSRVPWKVFAG